MRKLMTVVAMAGLMGLGASTGSMAAPVAGFDAQYNAVVAACTAGGTPARCEAAINLYSAALIAAGVAPDVALVSFTELRSEIGAANGGNATLLAQVDGLFEELLPESGDLGDNASQTTP